MPYFVYMLLTEHSDKKITYVGYTNNLENRLKLHNSSNGAKFTKGKKWKIIYKKKFTIPEKNQVKLEYDFDCHSA